MVKATPRPLYHRERHTLLTVQEAGWDTGPEWKSVQIRQKLGLTGIETQNGSAGSVSMYQLHYAGSIHITVDLQDRIERCGMNRKK
jgi:hypothetical protein